MYTCKKGHDVSGGNLYVDPKGKQHCKECRKQASQKHRDTDGTTYRLTHARHKPKESKPTLLRKPYPKDRARKPPIDRFFSKVSKQAACWLWEGMRTTDGYGLFCLGKRKTVSAHRWIFSELVGAIPTDKEIDHICNIRNCVNPAHLEPVSHQENIRRGVERGGFKNHTFIGKFNAAKTHCKKGHEYNEVNAYIDTHSGGRRCRVCMKQARENKGYLHGKEENPPCSSHKT